MPKQPLIGIASTILIILISLGFISLFSFPLFSGWICYFLLSIIPMQIVMGVTWGGKHPGFAASKKQPLKGILMTLFLCAVGVVVGGIYFAVPGGSVNPPAPMLMMCSIVSVVVMFWLAIMFGGWPFTSFIKSKVGVGAALMVACYVLNYILFRLFFDYGFMQGAPVYAPQLDPHGLFNAWDALVFYVTFSTVMFVMQSFDLWPLTKSPALIKQPVLGIIWSLLAFVIGGGAF
ncbi:MAG TPA: hypothetical protein VFW83_10880, partial [Bryobacteraceae bacterium]|nr:hypothetical protein [Bryobacteraceae bacterium]